ncbi:MAG: histidinol dehydrogenase [Marinirhabdus sp.]|nr:histidinol dehydrogenase [Marinirhabdus sp.]
MKTIINPDPKTFKSLLSRPQNSEREMEKVVAEIFQEVKKKGDAAVRSYTALFDGVQLETIQVSKEILETATVPKKLQSAIQIAKQNIEAFHRAQNTAPIKVETMPGVQCWQEKKPIEKVGLYIPGGTAPLFSSILMLAIPAQIAGCSEIVLCTPPNSEGEINPAILYCARVCGITKVFKVGGIQAIAAMTYGTESIPAVYKLFGPGNQYVTAAKQYATRQGVAIDMPAGPSELLVCADDSANASFIASDMLSQAEHGADSQVILVTTSQTLSAEVQTEIDLQLNALARKSIAEQALENSKTIIVDSKEEAVQIINFYAPEHLILVSEDEPYYLSKIVNAGSVFLGNYTPESAGDYASGTNHTLPTNGYAKQYSGVTLDSFMKTMSFQKISKQGLEKLGETIEIMAAAEGLFAHKNAVSLRLKSQNDE